MRSERKVVTVLFADIKGSIDLVARQDPEQAGEILSQVVSEMSDSVRRFGGVVNQVMGDGIMALFGAPLAIEEHATQACLAAMAMRQAVHERVRPRIQVRVGLSSGEVVVRAVPGDVALHYSAAGEAVHMAARMEQAAEPDQIVLTAAALHLTGGRAVATPLVGSVVKGLDAPMTLYLLQRVLPRRNRPSGPRQPDFVGRGTEMETLRRALADAASGQARAVRIVGDAGCGKSRLVREFTSANLPDEWLPCQAEAVPHRRTSYAVVADLLRSLFGLDEADPHEVSREKILDALAMPSREHPQDLMPPLASLLGLGPLPPAWDKLEARERRDQSIAASALSFQWVSLHRPVALVVEDAHWLDPESAEGIRRLGTALPGQRLLAIATERPGESPFDERGAWSPCHVRALDEDGTHALLRSLLLPGPDVPALERKLIEHTSGNPLFIEECLQSLVETGELVRVGGRFRLEAPVRVLRVPDSLRGLLDARVDRLVEQEKDVLQAASVVGTTVPLDLLQTVAKLREEELYPVLDGLCAAGFLTADEGGQVYAFRHGLIREAAYNGILVRSRVRMHAAVLDALEQRADATDAHVDLLANHAVQAESWLRAVDYSSRAAARAYDRYANPEAAHFYQQALQAAAQWPEGAERNRALLNLHIAVRWPLFRLGHVAGLRVHLDEAVALARAYADPERLGHSHILRSHVLWLAGEPDAALEAAESARQIAEETADRDLAVRAQFQTALTHMSQSQIQPMVAAMTAVLQHIGDPPPATGRYGLDAELAITALSYIARAHSAAGQLAAARDAVARATTLAEARERRQNWVYVNVADGVRSIADAHPSDAVPPLERAHDYCKSADLRLLRPVVAGFLALACAEAGQPARGVALAQEAVDEAERMGFMALHPMRLAILAQAYLVQGDAGRAATAADQARALAVRIKEPGAEAYALGLLGEAHQRQGDTATAHALFARSMAQAQELGLAPLAECVRRRWHDPADRAHPWLDGVALAP